MPTPSLASVFAELRRSMTKETHLEKMVSLEMALQMLAECEASSDQRAQIRRDLQSMQPIFEFPGSKSEWCALLDSFMPDETTAASTPKSQAETPIVPLRKTRRRTAGSSGQNPNWQRAGMFDGLDEERLKKLSKHLGLAGPPV